MAKADSVNVFCSGDVAEAVAGLVRAGLTVTRVLPRLRVVSGTVDRADREQLARVPGVTVESDHPVSAVRDA